MMCSGLIIFSAYKFLKNTYVMATSAGFMSSWAPFTLFWAITGFVQYNYLASAYIQQVYLVDEIELLENMTQVRIRTVFFNMKANLFAQARLLTASKDSVKKEYIVDIKDCKFSDKDKADSAILRIEIGDLKLFAHRQRTIAQNEDLVRAVFTPEVERIETLK